MNELHISEAAQKDLLEIRNHIALELENPGAALAVVRRITKRMRILQDHVGAGARLSSITDVESGYRFLVSGQYLIFYRVCGKDVYVDRVLYGRRNYLKVLFEETLSEDSEE